MKKGFMSLLCAVLLSVSAFADIIWDTTRFGYSNTFMKGDAKVDYDRYNSPTMVKFKEKGKMSMNTFDFMPLVAGLGYLPKKAGFFFMCENFLGLGKCTLKSEKFDKLFFDDDEMGSINAFNFSTNLIVGFAFSPVDDLHLSFGAGFAAGVFACESTYINTNLPSGVQRRKFSVAFSLGVPFDVTCRYYFTKRAGILFGLQDTIMLTLNETKSSLSNNDGSGGDLVRLKLNNLLFANKFTFKFGATTRW